METFKKYKQKADEILNRYRLYIFAFLFVFIIFVSTTLLIRGADASDKGDIQIIKSGGLVREEQGVIRESEMSEIVFDIEGAVMSPGVYRLPAGSVMDDGIKIAGGLSTEADLDRIAKELNKAAPIGNNAKIYLFKKSDKDYKLVEIGVSSKGNNLTSSNPNTNISTKININTADLTALDSLPGIGPAIGQRIIDWRDSNGGFEVIEDIKKVKGIGDSLYDGIKDLITVE